MGPLYSLNATGSYGYLRKDEQDRVLERLNNFVHQFGFEEPHVHLNIKEQNTSKKGDRGYCASIRIVSDIGEFVATQESFGAMKTVIETLNLVEQQVRQTGKKKRDLRRKVISVEEN